MERTCKKCGETKPIEEFAKTKDCKFGYRHSCKRCCNNKCQEEIKKQPNYYKEHYKKYREYQLKHNKEYYANNKEHYKKYTLLNREKICSQQRRRHRENPEHYNQISARYNKKYSLILPDSIIRNHIRKTTGLSLETINQHPELIEVKRVHIKLKRLIKNKENEKCNRFEKRLA